MIARSLITALVAGALLVPASASAAPIRECGRGFTGDVHNVTTRHLGCEAARRMAHAAGFIGYGEYVFRSSLYGPYWRRYRCRVRIPNPRSYRVDVRCTYRSNVVRWQYDSGE